MDSRTLRRHFVVGLFTGLRVVWPILSVLLGLIIALGVVVGLHEGWIGTRVDLFCLGIRPDDRLR